MQLSLSVSAFGHALNVEFGQIETEPDEIDEPADAVALPFGFHSGPAVAEDDEPDDEPE